MRFFSTIVVVAALAASAASAVEVQNCNDVLSCHTCSTTSGCSWCGLDGNYQCVPSFDCFRAVPCNGSPAPWTPQPTAPPMHTPQPTAAPTGPTPPPVPQPPVPTHNNTPGLPPQVTIRGNQLISTETGAPVFLGGVNSPGAVFPCVGTSHGGGGKNGYGYGVFDKNITETILDNIKAWNSKIIRFGMNEDCVLGINGINPAYSSDNYLGAIRETMERVLNAGLYLILELHWTAPGSTLSNTQFAMPDAHSPKVWERVVQEVLNKSSVETEGRVFLDVFQEPFPNNNEEGHDDATWKCWRDGNKSGSCVGWKSHDFVGMSDLVSAVRNAGGKHQILLGGVNYANGLYKFVKYASGIDPLNQIFASFHNYKGNACANEACWNSTIASVAEHYPILNGEVGETDCQHGFLTKWTSWLQSHNHATQNSVAGSLAWIFDDYGSCDSGPSLVTSVEEGTCTPHYGCFWKDWLLGLN